MKLSLVLTLSALYMAIIGIVALVAPDALSFGTVDASGSSDLMLALRMPSSMAIGIAILNWMARNADASVARQAVVMGNIVGFGLAGILAVWGGLSGGPSAIIGMGVLNLLFCLAFVMSGRSAPAAGDDLP